MEETNLENKILEKIQEIKPMPKAYFVAKNILLWVLWIMSIVVGALAFSVTQHMIVNNDWDMYKYVSDNLFAFILSTLPYFWILIMIAFVITAYINFAHTKGAYKYKIQTVIVSSLIFSVLLGVGFSYAQVGENIDKILSDNIPQYKQSKVLKENEFWNKPIRGILSGEILSVNDNGFVLQCCCNNIWNITGVNAKPFLEHGIKNVRVIGEKIGDKEFKAYDMRPIMKYKDIREKMKEIRKIVPQRPLPPPPFMMQEKENERKNMDMRINNLKDIQTNIK